MFNILLFVHHHDHWPPCMLGVVLLNRCVLFLPFSILILLPRVLCSSSWIVYHRTPPSCWMKRRVTVICFRSWHGLEKMAAHQSPLPWLCTSIQAERVHQHVAWSSWRSVLVHCSITFANLSSQSIFCNDAEILCNVFQRATAWFPTIQGMDWLMDFSVVAAYRGLWPVSSGQIHHKIHGGELCQPHSYYIYIWGFQETLG